MRPSRKNWNTVRWMLPGLVGLGCSAALVDADRSTPAARPGLMPPGVSNAAPTNPPMSAQPLTTTTAPAAERSKSDSLPHVPLDSVLRPKANDEEQYHEVKSGDSLTAIARRYKTTVGAIEQANGLDSKATLTPGQMLFIPK